MIKLFEFQKEVLNKSRGQSRVAYYYDMGLGKTYIGAEKLKELKKRQNLLICQKSKVADWLIHFNENKDYYGLTAYDFTKEQTLSSKREGFVAVVNYDLIFRRKEFLRFNNYKFSLLLDESSLVQNHTAKRTKFILNKLNPSAVILLSGTPVGGKYENLWSQLKLLGYNEPYGFYFDRYVKYRTLSNLGSYPIKIPYGYKNIEELKGIMRNLGCHFKKTEEVLTLPPQTFIEIDCKTPPYFAEFIKNEIVHFSWQEKGEARTIELVADTTLAKILRAREISGVYSEGKAEAFKDLLQSTNDRLIVFYCFNKELEIIERIARQEHRPLSVINGQNKDLTAYENDPSSITAVQYQAGSMGLNLQKANKVIYWSPTFSSDLFEQSKKRIHRIGQSSPCFYYLLKSGLDNRVYNVLKKRENYTKELFTQDSFLNFRDPPL